MILLAKSQKENRTREEKDQKGSDVRKEEQ
jgi:hypothetical protein